ncbi:MAG: TatD family hydrolase [Acidithiobacillus sp.]|nr:TatD family hydrolase [Acidithiobacillus sp.]
MQLADSHCHLDFEDFDGDREMVLQRARAAGVRSLLVAAVREPHWQRVRALAESDPEIWAAAGVHPNEELEQPMLAEALTRALDHPKVVAVGETGLDYYRAEGDLRWQQERFALHLAVARRVGKPVIVHTREAAADTLSLLGSEGVRECGGVIHCFTESADFAKKVLDLGMYISFSGIVTFKNARSLQEIASWVPAERLLIETDAPYLAPVPLRGQRNEPAHVQHVLAFLAQLRKVDPEELGAITSANFRRLFALPEWP